MSDELQISGVYATLIIYESVCELAFVVFQLDSLVLLAVVYLKSFAFDSAEV